MKKFKVLLVVDVPGMWLDILSSKHSTVPIVNVNIFITVLYMKMLYTCDGDIVHEIS